MKVAIDARIIYTSTGRYVDRLLTQLSEIDRSSQYVVLLLAKDFDRWRPPAANFSKQVANYPPYTLREQFNFVWQLYWLRVDLVHFVMPQHPVLYFKKHIITVHDLTLLDFINRKRESWLLDFYKQCIKPPVFRLVLKRGFKFAGAIITPTEFVKQDIVKRFHIAPSKIIPIKEAADALVTKKESTMGLVGQKFILYVGNAYPYKNIRTLIDAFEKLANSDLKLVLVGKKDFFYTELEHYIEQRGTEDVIFTGFVSDEELAWLYQNATLFVFPSLSEGFGLPPLEAMAAGLAVVSSRASCMPEVLGEAAEYFDPLDPNDIAMSIKRLLDDPVRRQELVRLGHLQVAKYSWRRMAEQTLEVYRAVGRTKKPQ